MPCYFRLVHISDLHFGDQFYVSSPCVPGLHTHDPLAAQGLSASVQIELQSEIPWRLVATGDLTTWGNPAAFQLAVDYIHSKVSLGAIGYGLNAPDGAVLPGNHDIWGGSLLGVAAASGPPAHTRHDFKQYFDPPCHSADYVHEVYPPHSSTPKRKPFPYRVCLSDGPPAIYLYGLDSTRLDAYPGRRWHNFWAYGFVDDEQIERLEGLVKTEPITPNPKVRIAAVHHPLAYPSGNLQPVMKTLLQRKKLTRKLQELGFALALCGHQHKGFIRPVQPTRQYEPLHVLSVGTCTQAHCLPLVQRPTASAKNEYRIYDFEDDPLNPSKLTVSVNSLVYDPSLFTFVKNMNVRMIPLDLLMYP